SLEHLALALGAVALVAIGLMNLNYSTLLKDTFVVSSTRLDEILSPSAYLGRTLLGFDVATAFRDSLNFGFNAWWDTWPFLGASVIGLTILGIVYGSPGRPGERWAFTIPALFTLLIQLPLINPIGAPAHLLIAFTNPFSFLLRHEGMAAYLLPSFLLP